VFVVLTAIDTSRDRANEWYAPVALIANTYILGLLLVVIWMTPYDSFSLMFQIFWKSFLVILVTRLVILCCELLLRTGREGDEAGNRFAFVTSVLAVLSGILFTAPVGIEAFRLHIPDLYWKIATAVLILTALGLSVTLLLRWANNSEERAAKRAADKAAREAGVLGAPFAPVTQVAPALAVDAAHAPAGEAAEPAHAPAEVVSPVAPQQTQQAQQPTEILLPWPTFADGRPIPARPDGQPDFSVPGAPLPPQF
jgi:cytochrome bd-type quinol oxidase subunit 2